MTAPADPYDLARFVDAQNAVRFGKPKWQAALEEISEGRKTTHWMWYIFPTLVGVGQSAMAQTYALEGLDEARAYLAHPVLGPRLKDISAAAATHSGLSAEAIFGGTDAYKLHNCATLFHAAAPEERVFQDILDSFYGGAAAEKSARMLGL